MSTPGGLKAQVRAAAAQLLADNPQWRRVPPSENVRIEKPHNIAALKGLLTKCGVSAASGEYIKVLHHVTVTYDDSSMQEAVAYIRDLYASGPDDPPAQQQPQAPQGVTPPPTEWFTVGKFEVELQPRAFRHLPPDRWRDLRRVARGSLATKIAEAGDQVKTWYQVMSTSEEQFTVNGRNSQIVTRASWNTHPLPARLVIYHAHPTIHNYGTYFDA